MSGRRVSWSDASTFEPPALEIDEESAKFLAEHADETHVGHRIKVSSGGTDISRSSLVSQGSVAASAGSPRVRSSLPISKASGLAHGLLNERSSAPSDYEYSSGNDRGGSASGVAAEASSPGATAATPVGDDIEMEVFGVRGVLQRGRRGRPPEEVEVFGVRGVLCDSRGPAEAVI